MTFSDEFIFVFILQSCLDLRFHLLVISCHSKWTNIFIKIPFLSANLLSLQGFKAVKDFNFSLNQTANGNLHLVCRLHLRLIFSLLTLTSHNFNSFNTEVSIMSHGK